MIIIDEAHNFFNIEGTDEGKTTHFAINLCQRAKQVILLTATPMNNSPNDLETLLAMIDGRKIDPNFSTRFIGKFDESNNLNVQTTDVCDESTNIPTAAKLSVKPTASAADIDAYFNNKIIFYTPPTNSTDTPPCVDIRSCAKFTNPSTEYTKMTCWMTSRKNRDPTECASRYTASDFGVEQDRYIDETRIKIKSIYDLIHRRESQDPNSLSTDTSLSLIPRGFEKNLRFKYVIFSTSTERIDRIIDTLCNVPSAQGLPYPDGYGFDRTKIGKITGKETNEERASVKEKMNNGILKIVFISKAGEEGVDFKRVSTVILEQPVYTWSEYEQIRGRAVRLNAHKPDTTRIDTSLVAATVECHTIILNQIVPSTAKDPIAKISWDLKSRFAGMINKRNQINYFKENVLDKMFIKISNPELESNYQLPH